MSFDLRNFNDPTLEGDYVRYLVEQEAVDTFLHFSRLWDYFRNPMSPAAGAAAESLNANSRPYFQVQEIGLPARITGINRLSIGGEQVTNISRKEVVIENDIAWRVHTMVEFLFGKPISIRSLAPERTTAEAVEAVVKSMFEANGGQSFCQELALLGSIFGFADVVIRLPEDWPSVPASPATGPASAPTGEGSKANSSDREPRLSAPPADRATRHAQAMARKITLEIVEAPRIQPILHEDDFRTVRYWIQAFRKQTSQLEDRARPFLSFGWGGQRNVGPKMIEVVEIIGPHWWQLYEDRDLVAEGPSPLGRTPVVHLQNLSLPASYEGLSDVEPLLPLQDELNTRLSDRASRVTYQSFRMYLAKGIDDFLERPVGPGQMWSTPNLNASVQEFGHDSGSPSEDAHIEQIRQAMDKISGVSPLAAGLIRGHVGNLTSATALKVLLSGLLGRTERKRITYGRALAEIVEMALDLLDRAGALPTQPEDRRVEIHWPSPLPQDEAQHLVNARTKLDLGVPANRVLAELGYDNDTLTDTNGNTLSSVR